LLKPETKEDDKDSIDAKSTDTDPKDNSNTSNKTADSTTPNTTVNTTDTESKNKTKKSTPKPTVMRENIEINVMVLDVMLPTETHLVDWKQRLEDLDRRDKEKRDREQAKNNLESHIFETQDALYLDAVITVSTEAEREAVSKALSEASDWLYDEGDQTTTDVYKDKLAELKKLSKGIFYRVKEMSGRPEAIGHLKQTLNLSEIFLVRVLNISEDEQIYTDVEIHTLANVTKEIKEWLFDMETKQNASNPTEDPILTINLIKEKGAKIDREIMYLINKAKWATPLKPKTNTTKANTTKEEQTILEQSDLPDSTTKQEEKQTEDEATKEPEESKPSDSKPTDSKPTDSSQGNEEEIFALPEVGGDEADSSTEKKVQEKEKAETHEDL
jgi:hypoxia up-regulated 1